MSTWGLAKPAPLSTESANVKRNYLGLLLALVVQASHPTGTHAQGDAANGQRLYESRCIGCHSIDHHRVGPAHRGVFGRRAGAAPGYDYSDAVKNAQLVWSANTLDRWLRNLEALIPGQKMGYSVSNAQDRADLIAFLMNATSPPINPPTEGEAK